MHTPFCIDIYIPESKSRVYRDVIERAEKTGYYDGSTGHLTIPSLPDVFRLWHDFTFVVWTCQKWSGFYVTINDKPVLPYRNDYYYLLQQLSYCVSNRIESAAKQDYCRHNSWGCQQLHGVTRYIGTAIYDNPLWYKFGKFISSDVWQIDKKAILDALKKEIDIVLVSHCPYFRMQDIESEVDRLPDQITIDDSWEIIYNVDYDKEGKAFYIPVSIHHKDQFEGYIKPITEQNKDVEKTIKPSDDIGEIDKFLDQLLQQKKRPK